jgi:hypothetical protein
MMAKRELASPAYGGWRKLAVLLLAVAAVGLPINHIEVYGLLLVAALVIFCGEVRASKLAWSAAIAIVAVAAAGQYLLAPPRIDEGHNVFLPGGPTQALEHQLPPEVYRQMAAEFDALYPPDTRCKPGSEGCWQTGGFPDAAYAFSADGIWHKSPYSRSVTELDFSDPVWLRLGFINELRYNWWSGKSDIDRVHRDRRFWMGLHRWHLAMPWYEVLRLPAAFVGGELCWRGEVMWEGADEHFSRGTGDGCRVIEPADVGRRIFGIAIKPDTLAMQVLPPASVRLKDIAAGLLAGLSVLAIVGVLVRFKLRQLLLPAILLLLALLVIAIDDASFIGGVRPFDGGNDGLFYDGAGRIILRALLSGNWREVLRGTEDVYFFTPGLRYFRALEHIVFGESYLGYLSLILALPFFVHRVFMRFLPRDWSLALVVLFTAVPVGMLFGTSFFQYEKWAARGFADPAAYFCFLVGMLAVIEQSPASTIRRVQSAFFGSLLLAFAVVLRPVVAPVVGVTLAGVGLFTLYRRDWPRFAALCLGFLPFFCMPLHNWYFGGRLVLFTKAIDQKELLVMPPSAYLAVLRELVTFDFDGGFSRRAVLQLAKWLSGPAESYWTIPLNAAGVAILAYVVIRGRRFDPWLRLIGGAALAQHAVAWFYIGNTARYHLLTWFLTMLVVMVFMHEVGIGWLQRRYPALSDRIAHHPVSQWLASGLLRLQKSAA